MQMRRFLILALASLMGGCANTELIVPVAAGGSAADGYVTMAYEHDTLRHVEIDLPAAQRTARDRCRGWGFYGAEPFDGETRTCLDRQGFGGCGRWVVQRQYQCRYTK